MKKLLIYIKLIIGYILFKIKYPKTLWVRPKKIGTFYSQDGQDLYLATLLFGIINRSHLADCWIIDAGCNHPIYFSNSYFFEKYFGCKVLAIDPLNKYNESWSIVRPNSKFINCALGNFNGKSTLNIPLEENISDMFSYVEGGFNKKMEYKFDTVEISIRKLTDLIEENNINDILFISLDIEGYELNALQGLKFNSVNISCICLENNSFSPYGSDTIRSYLCERGFVFYARIGFLDDIYLHQSVINGDELID
jgi:FkbM family methyltransferase